jgi:peptide/nickel transport system substrate-binding protein
MKRKAVWLILSCLIVTALVLTSCREAAKEEAGKTIVGKVVEKEAPKVEEEKEVVTAKPTGPQYGGTLTLAILTDVTYFDEVAGGNYGGHVYAPTTKYTHNELLQGDWARGPAGTNETDWVNGGDNRMDQKTGCLADSWTIPELGTVIFHIREGVHWQDKAPVNGRELTPEDIEFSLKRTMSGGYFKLFYAKLCETTEITVDSRARTVTIKVPMDQWVNAITLFPDYTSIVAREVIEKFGDEVDWRNSLGTGPFMLTDFVPNSSVTFTKNPNYWETDPVGPGKGNKLPYVDGVRWLVMVDPSTRMAAFRTGSVDRLYQIDYNNAKPILEDPKLSAVEHLKYIIDGCSCVFFRTDMPESPFSVKEVRQAMMLTIDQKKVVDDYFQGRATMLSWPVMPTLAYMDAYCPLEDLPANVQALYGHDVAAAKALLAEAGYPNGFSFSAITWNTPTYVDLLSMYKDMLADININMEISIVDYAVYNSITRARNYGPYEAIITTESGCGTYMKMIDFRGANSYNPSRINEDYSVTQIEDAYAATLQYLGTDEPAMMKIHRELMPWLLEQAYCLPNAISDYYMLWWPWLKNYYGTYACGYYNYGGTVKYSWIDRDLKFQMIGKR